ncbi:RagB/SusD family nutrient uptake outer membrane protein [Puteibacter caeruleilacunae]|nr:RagB/SusD family nutrient uptake outer membrane protein [Puteibacter caeruleilacunae]
MKRNIYQIILILAVSFYACSDDYLDKVPLDKLSDETSWKTESDAFMAINGCYDPLGWRNWDHDHLYHSYSYLDACADNAWSKNPWEGYTAFAQGQQNSKSPKSIEGRYRAAYRGIGRCNYFLENIDRVEMDADKKARMTGEAYFLRALYYFNLTEFYGGVPLVLKKQSPDEFETPRSSREDVEAQILKDCDEAFKRLPKEYTGDDQGRATKGAAMTLKAKLLLHKQQWAAAATACKTVIDLGAYDLHPEYRELFLPENELSNEIIFAVQYMKEQETNKFNTYYSPKGYGWRALQPLLGFVEFFHCKDGLPITISPLYDENDPYTNRDPRLNYTVVCPGQEWNGKIYGEGIKLSNTGFVPRKYTLEPGYKVPTNEFELNYIVFRYADVLLMYAEALIESSGAESEILWAINEVRGRESVKMPAIETGLSTQQLTDVLRYERRAELGFEGYRYHDMLRWGIGSEIRNGPTYGIRMIDSKGAAVPSNMEKYKVDDRSFDSKDALWPIPYREVINFGLLQNPGY